MTLQTAAAAAQPYIPGRARSEVLKKAFFYAVLILVALVFFVPFLWTLATSFKTIPDSASITMIGITSSPA